MKKTKVKATLKMCNHALSMHVYNIHNKRCMSPAAAMAEQRLTVLRAGAGNLTWLATQLQSDLLLETGDLRKQIQTPCVADLVPLEPNKR